MSAWNRWKQQRYVYCCLYGMYVSLRVCVFVERGKKEEATTHQFVVRSEAVLAKMEDVSHDYKQESCFD